jgi:hypothetical protein
LSAALVLLLILAAVAKDNSIEELKAKFQNATRPDERANLALEIAERQVDGADKLYRENKMEEAQKAVADAVTYSGQARDAASVTGHRLKNTEIGVRKMIHRLTDVKRQLTYEDQAPVQAAIDQLEKIRTDLLNRMFKGGK